jgi:hypothetical protein
VADHSAAARIAPELNPVEGLWAHIKRSLANLAACTLRKLETLLRRRIKALQYRPAILEDSPRGRASLSTDRKNRHAGPGDQRPSCRTAKNMTGGEAGALGHRRLLVRGDVVRPAPRGGDGGAQLLADHHAGEDGPLVLQRTRGISHSPGFRSEGRGAAGVPDSAGGCRSGAVAGGRRAGSRPAGAQRAV